MDIEIKLDVSEAAEEDQDKIEARFFEWYNEGSEVRYDKSRLGSMTELEGDFHYRVDLGQVDPFEAVRDLHARLHRLGAKVFVHFLYY